MGRVCLFLEQSDNPNTRIERLSYRWYPIRKDPGGEFLIIHNPPIVSDYKRTNPAGSYAHHGQQLSNYIKGPCEQGGNVLPCFWGAFLEFSLALQDDITEYIKFIRTLADTIQSEYLEEFIVADPRNYRIDIFGVCIRKEGSTMDDTARTPYHFYFPTPQNPDIFKLKDKSHLGEIEEWAKGWANKLEDFAASCQIALGEGLTGFRHGFSRPLVEFKERTSEGIIFEFKDDYNDKVNYFRVRFGYS